VDTHKQDGLFWLTGSQKFHLMQGTSNQRFAESLAGRVAILDMLGFSQKELRGQAQDSAPFLPSPEWVGRRDEQGLTVQEVYSLIWDGSFPKMMVNPDTDRETFYRSYIQTYIERDVKDFHNIKDEIAFYNFLSIAAARTGSLLNYNDFARDAGIDVKTVKLWLSILERSGLVILLQPWFQNRTKRMIKTPKLYFLDTGLCAYLTGWDTPQALGKGALSGAILETWVFTEILKSYWHNGKEPLLYFYRDHDQQEIDFVIEQNGMLYPMEVKKTAAPHKADLRNFGALAKLGKPVGQGAVLCFQPGYQPISREVMAMPVWGI
jgi:predicted AAA+ superfamily ATPase